MGVGEDGVGVGTSEGTGVGVGAEGAGVGTSEGTGVGVGEDGAGGSTSSGEGFSVSDDGVQVGAMSPSYSYVRHLSKNDSMCLFVR